MIKVVIEIPKGDDRRRHKSTESHEFIDLGPIKNIIPVNDGVMPVHYGYIPNTKNPIEKDEIDALVISSQNYKAGEEVKEMPIALIIRADGDNKVVAIDEALNNSIQSWSDVDSQQAKLITDFFGHNHKILEIKNSEAANDYIN